MRYSRRETIKRIASLGLVSDSLLAQALETDESLVSLVDPQRPSESRRCSSVELGGKPMWQHLPFEFSPEFLRGDFHSPVTSQKDREYDRVVGLIWSGVNTRNAYLRAVEATCVALDPIAEEIHVFCAKRDFEILRRNRDFFPHYHKYSNKRLTEHQAEASSFIGVLRELYLETIANPNKRIFVVINISNHGAQEPNRADFEIPAPEGKHSLTERDLALVGMLLAPLDFVMVSGVCFGGNIEDIILQNAMAQRASLRAVIPEIQARHISSMSKGCYGLPSYDADQFGLYEQLIFSLPGNETSVERSLQAGIRNRGGSTTLAKEYSRGFKYAANIHATRSEKLGLYSKSIQLFREGEITSPTFTDETAPAFQKIGYKESEIGVEDMKNPLQILVLRYLEITARLVESYELLETEFTEFAKPGDTFAKLSSNEGFSKTNVSTGLHELIRKNDIMDQEITVILEKEYIGVKAVVAHQGENIDKNTAVAILEETAAEIDVFLAGKIHKNQIATAWAVRYMNSAELLLKNQFKLSKLQYARIRGMFEFYLTNELFSFLPEPHPEFLRTGKGPRAIHRFLG